MVGVTTMVRRRQSSKESAGNRGGGREDRDPRECERRRGEALFSPLEKRRRAERREATGGLKEGKEEAFLSLLSSSHIFWRSLWGRRRSALT